jgi:hypothetical protein
MAKDALETGKLISGQAGFPGYPLSIHMVLILICRVK